MGSEAFVASGDKEKAERVSRNERPLAATIEAADAARRRETSAVGKAIDLSENSITGNVDFIGRRQQLCADMPDEDLPSGGTPPIIRRGGFL